MSEVAKAAAAASSARHRRVARLVSDWQGIQGDQIETARGPIVATACRQEVERIARARDGADSAIVLTLIQIERCEDAVVSQARMLAYGPYSLRRNDEGTSWRDEMAAVRALIRAGQRPMAIAAVDQAPPESPDTRDRLKDLAAAYHQGRKLPPRGATP